MTSEQALAFAGAAAILTVLPGADTFLVLRNTLRHGRTTGLVTTVGICSGLFVHATVSSIGMATVLRHAPRAWSLLQAVGALYLGWLGIRSLREAVRIHRGRADAPEIGTASDDASIPRRLLEGFLCNVLNPKTMVFYLAFLPQFLRPVDPVWSTSLALTSIHGVEGLAWLAFLVAALSRVRPWLLRASTLTALEAGSGLLLLGFGLRLALA